MTAQQTFRNTLVVICTFVLAYAIYRSVDIMVVLLIAIIIASAVRPSILWLEKRRVPQGVAILIVYGAIAISIFSLAVLILPPAANQLGVYIQNDQRLASRLIASQNWIERNIERTFNTDVELLDPEAIRITVGDAVEELTDAIPALVGQFGGLFGYFVLVFVMGVYWITSRDQALIFVSSLFSMGRRGMVLEIIREIEYSLGSYVRGVTLITIYVGVANFILLSIFGVPNAVTIAFIIGVTTALPIIGGFIGAGVGVLLAVLHTPLSAVATFASFVIVQQFETHYLTPRTMSKSVGLNPILVIVFLFVGFAVGGVVGGLIAVPVAGTIAILLRYLVIEPRKEENAPQHVEGGILIARNAPTATPAAVVETAPRK